MYDLPFRCRVSGIVMRKETCRRVRTWCFLVGMRWWNSVMLSMFLCSDCGREVYDLNYDYQLPFM